MDQTLSLGWTQAESASRRGTYQKVLGLNLILYAVLALYALIWPASLSETLGLPYASPSGWVRAWAGMLLLTALLYIPGRSDPVRRRWGNVFGIVGRLLMAVLYAFLGGGFLWIALFELVFGLALAYTYFNLFKAEIMSRP